MGGPRRSLVHLREHPTSAAGGILAVLALGLFVDAHRRRRTPASVRSYNRALRRSGLRLDAGETPRELLSRARREQLPRDRVEALASATAEHERARYAA